MYRSGPARRTEANNVVSVGQTRAPQKFKWGARNVLKKPKVEDLSVPETTLVFGRLAANFTTIGRRKTNRSKKASPKPTHTPNVTRVTQEEAQGTVECNSSSTPPEKTTEPRLLPVELPSYASSQASETSQVEAPTEQLPCPALEPQRSLHETRYFLVERETGLPYRGGGGRAAACYASIVPVSKVECTGRGRRLSRRARVVGPGDNSWIDIEVSGAVVAREVTHAVLAETGCRVFRTTRAAEFHDSPNGPSQYWHSRRHRAIAGSTIRAPAGSVFLAEDIVEHESGRSWVQVRPRLWLPVESADGIVLEEQRVCESGAFEAVEPVDIDVESNCSESMSTGYTTAGSQMSEGSEHAILRKAHREPPTKGDCALIETPMKAILERGESKVEAKWKLEEWEIGL